MQKINGITGLRGIIALIIIVYHLQQIRPVTALADWDWALYQFINMLPVVVAVFFILTGLLRSLGYWDHIIYGKKKPDTRKVIIDRWWRIAPVYYTVLIVSFIWSMYISGFSVINLWSLFSGFTFMNWASPTTFFPSTVNGPLWFIGYDMIGYIFTILMMIGLTRINKKYIYSSIIAYIFIFFIFHAIWISLPWIPGQGIVSVWFPYYSPFIFALYSIMGIIIGGIVTRYRDLSKSLIWDFIFFVSIVSICAYLWIIRGASDLAYSYPMSPYRFPIIPGLFAILVFSLIYSRYVGVFIDNRLFIWLAGISYSLYLWHGLIITILLTTVFHYVSTSFIEWVIFSIVVLAISLLVALSSSKYIENIRK
ncbi:acyltransferase [Candidatus Gracilibacteria bacterium]|nr:acyltransferase [Candidatus Gracilibacteria bacterium]